MIKFDEIKSIFVEEVNKCMFWGFVLWGVNSWGMVKRGKVVLKWEFKFLSLKDMIKEVVEFEVKNFGLVKGYVEKVVGDVW